MFLDRYYLTGVTDILPLYFQSDMMRSEEEIAALVETGKCP